jgi:uncharacterized membrane protein
MPARDPESDWETPIFTAILRPHRSLSPRGLSWVIGLTALAGFVISLPFFFLGAWPILGFMGLDVALIALAFRINAAEGRNEEQIFLSRVHLLVRNLGWRGEIREAGFNPRWSKLEREDHPEFGLERLDVVQGRTRQEVARCLGREDRAEFAEVFGKALAEAKR